MMRAYELMIIVDSDVAEADIAAVITRTEDLATTEGGADAIKSTDNWGRRRFAYEINHKNEGTYVVWEIVTENPGLPNTERQLRLADDIVRHKLFRLPDKEAARRGLLGDGEPAVAG
ncbi:MAG: 30S ribosomal protein S6 [Acidimicrobiaceae bacterium]|nr:30S ribosomal protein S6 [Acidimicrobiaceae bacterium]MBT5579864.1 30S ribosomal protein S6 [Acidimicrobiaceae bacterium]MBT5851497.1 30S ribosomal protein S6 [Acidimicrobiaceae bacterium]